MPNATFDQYNFFRRYLWEAEDFERLRNSLIEQTRGLSEGLLGASVLRGLSLSASGLTIDVSAGIAVGPTGNLLVRDATSQVVCTAPTGSDPQRNLIVIRPTVATDQTIVRPTSPNDVVVLREVHGSEIVLVEGTPDAEPEYPTIQLNDVVLAGIRLDPSSVAIDVFDTHIRDAIGVQSFIQARTGLGDRRCLPRIFNNSTIGILPSQSKEPKFFTYVGNTLPSKFPKNLSGNFNEDETFIDFNDGFITGGDAVTPDFAPTIPSAGNAIVASVGLTQEDELAVLYGVQGTRAQCFEAIENKRTVGAGAVAALDGALPIAFVVIYSGDGISVTEIDLLDTRPFMGSPSLGQALKYPNVILDAAGGADATTLQNAVALLPASGGVVTLASDVSVPDVVVFPPNSMLLGRSRNSIIDLGPSAQLVFGQQGVIRDVQIRTADPIQMVAVTGNYFVAEDSTFIAPTGVAATAITIDAEASHIESCRFNGVISPSPSEGIVYLSGVEHTSEANVFE